MALLTAKVDSAGRVMIPKKMRDEMSLQAGEELVVELDGGQLKMWTRKDALRRAQKYFAQFKKPGQSVVGELIKMRRDEVRREFGPRKR